MDYLVAKLVNGDVVVGLAGDTADDHVQLCYPFEIYKDMQVEENLMVSRTMLRPYCPYSQEQIAIIQMSHVIYIAPLKESLVKVYKDMVDAYEEAEAESSATPPEEPQKTFLVDSVDTLQ